MWYQRCAGGERRGLLALGQMAAADDTGVEQSEGEAAGEPQCQLHADHQAQPFVRDLDEIHCAPPVAAAVPAAFSLRAKL